MRPEVHVKLAPMMIVAFAVSAMACVKPKPKSFGTAPDLTPSVVVTEKTDSPMPWTRVPLRLKITLPEGAQVAAFFVTPGSATRMLYPTDSTGSAKLEAGEHEISTIFAQPIRTDTAGLLRRAEPDTTGTGGRGGGGYGNGGRRNNGYGEPQGQERQNAPMFSIQSYILVYASSQPLSLDALQDFVVGMSVPIGDNDALDAVTKQIRKAAKNVGPWSAYSVPFTP